MNRVRLASVFLLGIASSAAVQAEQVVRPGLWEVTTRNVQLGGQALPDLGGLMQQIKGLPADQQKKMQEVLGQQGMAIGGQGMQVCLSERQVQSETLMFQNQGQGCTQKVTDRQGDTWHFTFQCPQASGEGQARVISDQEFSSQVTGNFVVPGGMGRQPGSMEYYGRWKAADCGTLKPAG